MLNTQGIFILPRSHSAALNLDAVGPILEKEHASCIPHEGVDEGNVELPTTDVALLS